MRQLVGGLLALLVALAMGLAFLFGPKPDHAVYKILFINADGSIEKLNRGLDRLYRDNPELASRMQVRMLSRNSAFADAPLPTHDALVVELLDGAFVQSLQTRIAESRAPVRIALGPSGLTGDPDLPQRLALRQNATLDAYWENSSPAEIAAMLKFFLARYLGEDGLMFDPPNVLPAYGYLSFTGDILSDDDPDVIKSWPQWLVKQNADDQSPDRFIGILDYATRARVGGLAISRAIAEAVRQKGYVPVPMFAERAGPALEAMLFNDDGTARVQVLISLHHKFFEDGSAEQLQRLGIPVINAITMSGRTIEEWHKSTQGLMPGEIARQLAIPELAGLAPPNVVGGVDNSHSKVALAPIAERVERVAGRAVRYAQLRSKPLAQQKVGILYWNYPPGKQNVGASYLNVIDSIPLMLRRLQVAGYDPGNLSAFSDQETENMILERGLNVGGFAPGQLKELVSHGDVAVIPVSLYNTWFRTLPQAFRKSVIATWGEPEDAAIMMMDVKGELSFVLPVIRFNNVVVMPQPDRARTQNLEALYQSQELPPHHQYVAAYLWLQHEFHASAIVHTGTHGTHEWMSGKESGLSGEDPGEVLAGDMAIIYPYIVDDVGEGIVAKRRGMATVVDHLTPSLGDADLAPELAALSKQVSDWRMAQSTDPQRAAGLADNIIQEVQRRGINSDLADRGWNPDAPAPIADRLATLENYLVQIKSQTIPLGLHTFGKQPAADRLQRFTDKISEANGDVPQSDIRQRLLDSAPAEFSGLLAGLQGQYVRPGAGNDPLRNVDAIPTGKNFMTFDPRRMPLPSADKTGQRMAEELIATHRQTHGKYPEKIALQLWGVESLRHQGVQEAQGLALLGVRALRAENGRIRKLELIPREELGRPRVDVIFHGTSLYRDTFPMLFQLLDHAVQMAAASPEADNPLRKHMAATQQQLIAQGFSADQALQQSHVRIFAEPAGKHDSKIYAMTHASGSWDNESQVAENYIRRMGHAFGSGLWGQSAESAFRAALKDTDLIVHSRSSSLYATLDNDDYFSYGGSIALGVRHANGGGPSPDFYVTDLRQNGKEHHEPLARFMGQELRSRYLNPEFARQMMREGYAGARHVWKAADYLWGWQVVYPEAVDDAKWQEMYEVWLDDRYELNIDEFFEKNSPYARQGIAARMLETVRKGYWQPDDKTLSHLTQIYTESLASHGPACDHLSCNDPELQVFVQQTNARLGAVPADIMTTAMQSIENATQTGIAEALSQRQADKQKWHGPQNSSAARDVSAQNSPQTEPTEPVSGYKMEEEQVQDNPHSHADHINGADVLAQWLLLLSLLVSLLSGVWHRSRQPA